MAFVKAQDLVRAVGVREDDEVGIGQAEPEVGVFAVDRHAGGDISGATS
jgi:hypothetical protein